MNWIEGIQKALDYTEEHLLEDLDYDLIASQACSSTFHFQRVFSILCSCSLGDYIRMRRLSLAAEELADSDNKIIDIAMKYGYDTPESFTRAFSRFHGVTPREAKNGAKIRSFTRLFVKLILTGGSKMDYRIETLDEFKVICKRQTVGKPESAANAPDIMAFWQQAGMDGTIQRVIKYFPQKPHMKGLLGICFSSELAGGKFPYGIGIEYDGRPVADEDLEIVTIPAHTYAVFTNRGKMPEIFIKSVAI